MMTATVFFYVDSATGELQRTNSTDPDHLCYDVPEAVTALLEQQPVAVRAGDAPAVIAALRQVAADDAAATVGELGARGVDVRQVQEVAA